MKNYGKPLAVLVAAWFVFSLLAGALGLFANTSSRIGPGVALGAAVPVLLFALWYVASESFRRYVLSLDPVVLTMGQSIRMAGLMFLVLQAYQILPTIFAYLAGLGDILVGATAFFAAQTLAAKRRRNGFIWWQITGIADLVIAVGTGVTWGFLHLPGPSVSAMTVLPMSIVPTFLVPLFFIVHVICIAQARRWNQAMDDREATIQSAFAR